MKVFFRVDASTLMGTGHFMRCLMLAETLRERGAEVLDVSQETDAAETIEALRGERLDWLVVDHYGLDATWERMLRPHVGKVLVIDDLANRPHDCDALLDQSYSLEGEARYQGQVSPECRCLIGPRYPAESGMCGLQENLISPQRQYPAPFGVFCA